MLGTESCLPCHPHALAPKECGQPATLVCLGWLLTGPGGDGGLSGGPQAAANEPLRRALPLRAVECGWLAGLFLWPQAPPPVLCTRASSVVLWWTAAVAEEAPYNYV